MRDGVRRPGDAKSAAPAAAGGVHYSKRAMGLTPPAAGLKP
ncbi:MULTISPECIES: hypothetical protein [Paenibacillus]|nr:MULTISPECIES: hypothetical protein [Paenibacillus]SDI98657.1 hypothetical protein SAMN05421868_11473 [Paenibacillus naphthalenovorans]